MNNQATAPSQLWRVNAAMGILLAGATLYFIYWGLGYTNHNHTLLFIAAVILGVFMAFNIGGNDVANSFGTSVGAGTLTIPQALGVAAIFEVSGAVIAGGEVTDTIRKGIVDLDGFNVEPMQFVYIMMAALAAAAFWLLFATKKGWPVSTTHSIIGGLVGASITLGVMVVGGADAVQTVKWEKIWQIVISWVLSPILGGVCSYLLYGQIKKYVLNYNDAANARLQEIKQEKKAHKKQFKSNFERLSEVQKLAYTNEMVRDAQTYTEHDVHQEDLESDYYRTLYAIDAKKHEVKAFSALQHWVPIFAAMGGAIISSMLLFKGLKNLHLELTTLHNFLIMGMVAAVIWMATFIYAKTLRGTEDLAKATFILFSWMQVFTAAGFAFSHGSNDIANAIGPFAAILDTIRTDSIDSTAPVPTIAMITFGVALIVGLWFIGKEVIQTVGTNLTKMHPASGFSAELSAAAVVMIASMFGLPVSSTHILVGAVLGIGMVNKNANWQLMKPIAMAWVITVPAAAVLGAVGFWLLDLML